MATKKVKIVPTYESETPDEAVGKDEKKELIEEENIHPHSSCSLWLILLVLIFVLVALIALLVFLNFRKISLPQKEKVAAPISQNISDKINSVTGEETTIKITEEELAQALNTGDANFPLKKTTVKITQDKITISGKTGEGFLALGVEVGIVPKVEAGKVEFEISEIKSAGVTAPKAVSDKVNDNLKDYFNGISSSFSNIDVKEIKLYSGYMTVTGTKL